VNVRYVLHTQPLRFIYNKILVEGISLSIFVSIYPCWINFLPPTSFSNHCMLSFCLPYLSFSILSTHTLLTAKDIICNANDHGPNNAMNRPPLDLLFVMQTQLLETLVNATRKIIGATHRRKTPYQERQSMMLARLWINGLRSNVTP
jgi:hypothetical protein